MSYANLTLYMATLPSYNAGKKKDGYHDDGRRLDASDPKNDAEIRKILGFDKRK